MSYKRSFSTFPSNQFQFVNLRDYLKLSFVSFNLRCPPCQLSTFSLHPSATGATNVREAPKGSPASRKAWCPPQAATKRRTKIQKSSDAFHDSALPSFYFKLGHGSESVENPDNSVSPLTDSRFIQKPSSRHFHRFQLQVPGFPPGM